MGWSIVAADVGVMERDKEADDHALLARWRATRDTAALAAFFDRHRATAWRVARRLTGNAADADDVLQDAFCALLRAAASYREQGSARAWLLGIVVHVQRQRARGERRRARREALAPPPLAEGPDAEAAQALRGALAALPARYRLPLELRYAEGLAFPDIAAALGAPERTVRTWVHRGVDRLRRQLRPRLTPWACMATICRCLRDAGSPGPSHPPLVRPGVRTSGVRWRPIVQWAGVSLLLGAGVAVVVRLAGLAGEAPAPAPGPAPTPVPPAAVPWTRILAQRTKVRLVHDHLEEAMAVVNRSLPPPLRLRWCCPAAWRGMTFGGWEPPYAPWTGVTFEAPPDAPLSEVVGEIARQLGLVWTVDGAWLVFSRPLPPADRQALQQAIADGSLLAHDGDPVWQGYALLAKATSDWAFLRMLRADPAASAVWARLHAFLVEYPGDPATSFLRALPGEPAEDASSDPLAALLGSGPATDANAREDELAVLRAIEQPDARGRCRAALRQPAVPVGALAVLAEDGDPADLRTVLAHVLTDDLRQELEQLLVPGVGAPPGLAAVLENALGDERPSIRRCAADLLAESRSLPIVARLTTAFLRERDRGRHQELALALGQSREPSAAQALLGIIRAGTDPERWRILEALEASRDATVIEALQALARTDPDGNVRGAAIHTLFHLGVLLPVALHQALLRLAVQALNDPHPHARGAAVEGLANGGVDVARVADLAQRDPDGYVRTNAAFALYALANDATGRDLHVQVGRALALQDPDPQVRCRGLDLLAQHRADAMAVIAQVAEADPAAALRARACQVLHALLTGDEHLPADADAQACLTQVATADPDPTVRAAAAGPFDPDTPGGYHGGCSSMDWEERTDPTQAPPRTRGAVLRSRARGSSTRRDVTVHRTMR